MRVFLKKYGLAIGLFAILIIVVLNAIAIAREAIELAVGISIYALFATISILLVNINDIRNRLRPWVAVAKIDIETTSNPDKFYSHFIITNTGTIPATRIHYTTRWHLQDNNKWKEIDIPRESPFTSDRHTLFPNQSIDHRTSMKDIKAKTRDKDTKVTFKIEYHGLWSKHTTTNTFRFIYAYMAWAPDEPQDYT